MVQRTRIVCTLGPASDSDAIVRAMIRSGMDVVRLNFSHGDHATHAARVERVRRLAREENTVIAIFADLQGPKIRVGKMHDGVVQLAQDATLTLTNRPVIGTKDLVSIDYPDLAQSVGAGSRILVDDGLIELQVVSVTGVDVVTRVVNGGGLKSNKGVNLPGVPLNLSALTAKDRADVAFAIEQGVDYVALSFVRRAADVSELKKLIESHGAKIPVIAKIEKPEAVAEIDAILQVSDAVMVARGDLGVEASPEQVPIFQKTIIHKANAAGKPVITATQMLESMIESPRPTRAEASDVANAILDGTDAVMLSGETAIGKYPVQAVQMMAHIGDAVEASLQFKSHTRTWDGVMTLTDAIGNATCEIAKQLSAKLIITATQSGFTARAISRQRPLTPIFAVTSSEQTQRRLALVWGIRSSVVSDQASFERVIEASVRAAEEEGLVARGDLVVITAGVPAGIAGRTNMIQVRVVGEDV